MKLEQTIQMMFDEHPSLFQHRWEALVYMFLYTGTGYDWVDGELVDFYGSGKFSGILSEDGKAVQRKKDDILDSVMKSYREMGMDEELIASMMERVKNNTSDRHKETPALSDMLIFGGCPLYDYPENVKPDWVAGMEEARQILVKAGVPHEVVYGAMDESLRTAEFDRINEANYLAKQRAASEERKAQFDSLGPEGLKLLAEIWEGVEVKEGDDCP